MYILQQILDSAWEILLNSVYQMVCDSQLFDFNLSFNLRVVKMAEGQKRAMRARKPPNYLNSEEEDRDALLQNRPSYKKDVKQTTLQLNAMAKLLVKFVTQANQYYRDCQKDIKKQKKDREKKPELQPPRIQHKAEQSVESYKRQIPIGQKRIPKQQYSSHSALPSKSQTQGSFSRDQMQRGITSQGGINAIAMDFLMNTQGHPELNKNFSQMQGLYPANKNHLNTQGSEQMRHLTSQMQLGSKLADISSPKEKSSRQNQSGNGQNLDSLSYPNEAKLFKRSSYHVAIAYHIHFKQLEAKNREAGSAVDPTSHAKKLREEKMKGSQDNAMDQTSSGDPANEEQARVEANEEGKQEIQNQ